MEERQYGDGGSQRMNHTLDTGPAAWTAPLPVPSLLARLASDEYPAPVYRLRDLQALEILARSAAVSARRLGFTLAGYYASRMGTVASLCAINAAASQPFYRVSASASVDGEEADEILRSGSPVIDVQTHFVAGHRAGLAGARGIHHFIRHVAPEWFSGLDLQTDLSIGEFLRCVFLESETSLAVLTSAPGTEETNILSNAEIAGTRELVDRLAGSGRLLHHAIVHPNLLGELENMARIVERCRPDGFKVYTLYGGEHGAAGSGEGWMLDDEDAGLPFLQRAQELGVKIICAHKGLSMLAPTGSPRDIGPAAAAFPELKFLVYHSGYEVPSPDSEGEGVFAAGVQQQGTDRLVQSLRDAGVAPGRNVYAELGSTWYILIRRPEEAAHVIGKLLLAVGEDNILWGTDSVWYGSAQPLIDAFRAFHIPEEYQERYGYPPLTDSVKNKILGLNAARVYGVDAQAALERNRTDDLAWIREAVLEFDQFSG
jgi:predicted TIM-barrel fold metal-dependent hydrolase